MMQADEIIILAGGQGTRLQPVLGGMPKCLAPIGQQPFLSLLIRHYKDQGIRRFVFSLGVGSETILRFLEALDTELEYEVHIEHLPLGTGGAVSAALNHIQGKHCWIANGDTLIKTNMKDMEALHFASGSLCTLALAEGKETGRFGAVQINKQQAIIGFTEKAAGRKGWINGGLYLLNRKMFLQMKYPEAYSWEKDFLQAKWQQADFFGYTPTDYFIDIGTPEDYFKAQIELLPHDT